MGYGTDRARLGATIVVLVSLWKGDAGVIQKAILAIAFAAAWFTTAADPGLVAAGLVVQGLVALYCLVRLLIEDYLPRLGG